MSGKAFAVLHQKRFYSRENIFYLNFAENIVVMSKQESNRGVRRKLFAPADFVSLVSDPKTGTDLDAHAIAGPKHEEATMRLRFKSKEERDVFAACVAALTMAGTDVYRAFSLVKQVRSPLATAPACR